MSQFLVIANHYFKYSNFNNDFILLHPKAKGCPTILVGKAIFKAKFQFIDEVIVTSDEICLKINSYFSVLSPLKLSTLNIEQLGTQKVYTLPVYFNDHKDWTAVTNYTGLSKPEVIRRIKVSTFSVAMLGFIPGFLYLDGLPKACHVPRKTNPDKYIDAKSIAIGGSYLGLYSLASPGGWNVIGQCPLQILQKQQLPPLAIDIQDTIRIKSVDYETFQRLMHRKMDLITYQAIV